MKLYCYRLIRKDNVVDVGHMVASSDKVVHKRLEATHKECLKYELDEFDSYSFFEVNDVDSVFNIRVEKKTE